MGAAYRDLAGLAYGGGRATPSSIASPVGIVNGDVLLAMFIVGSGFGLPPTVSLPAGFTLFPGLGLPTRVADTGGFTVDTYFAWKIAASETGLPYDFTWAGGGTFSTSGWIMAVSGADISNIAGWISVLANQTSPAVPKSITVPSLTPANSSGLFIYAAHNWDLFGGSITAPTVVTPPPTFTDRYNSSSALVYAGTAPYTTNAATGIITQTNVNTASNEGWTGIVVAAPDASSGVTVGITGVTGTGSVGNVQAAFSIPATGVSGAGSVGSVKATNTLGVTGVSGSGSPGALKASFTITVAGVGAIGSVGTLKPSLATPLTGVTGTGTAGTVGTAGDVTVGLTGVSATTKVGNVTPFVPPPPSGPGHSGYLRQVLIEVYEREWEEEQLRRVAEREAQVKSYSPTPSRVIRVKKVQIKAVEPEPKSEPVVPTTMPPPEAELAIDAALSITAQELIGAAMTSLIEAEDMHRQLQEAKRRKRREDEELMVQFMIRNGNFNLGE